MSCQRNDYLLDLSSGFPISGLVRLFQIDSGLRTVYRNELVYSLDKNSTCLLPIIQKFTYGEDMIVSQGQRIFYDDIGLINLNLSTGSSESSSWRYFFNYVMQS